MKTSDIKGIIPPVITPMNNDPEQTVNHQALREQVERLLTEEMEQAAQLSVPLIAEAHSGKNWLAAKE